MGWLLAAAMLDSIASDLGRLRRRGLWKDHPCEMRKSVWYRVPCDLCLRPSLRNKQGQIEKKMEWFETPQMLLSEFRSQQIDLLFEMIRSATDGRVVLSRNFLIMKAKEKSMRPIGG